MEKPTWLSAAMLHQLSEQAASFMMYDLRTLLGTNISHSDPSMLKVELSQTTSLCTGKGLVNVFHFLMITPIEYISKDLWHILATAALVTD